jgi:hypothetical protein
LKKDIKNITPTLPSPLRGGGLGWGGENEISENIFATTE